MRRKLPIGTVTFLFTDIEGSTRLLHELGPDAYAGALAEHRRVLRDSFAVHDGVEVDTQGDAFFVAFPTATGAAEAALAASSALADGPVRVRIGLHTGAPTVTADGYVGIDVHRGARIAALAHGGQIVLSSATAELLDDGDLVDLGSHRLKDLDGATRVFQLGRGAFPPVRTPGSVELPTPATSFLGREQELFDAVSVVLERRPRVLTVVGPGGTGKTRFAIELARLLADEAEGGTVFLPLAPIREPGLVGQAIAEKLGAASPEPAAIAAATRGRRTHVVLDNLEHLLPPAAHPVAALVEGVPSLRLLVTSREALRIRGEEEFDLPPLVQSEAAELFLARARAVRPEIEHSGGVEELCRRLDRLPLAIELAAARSKLLTPDALLDRLGERLDLLRGTRDADPRHATLRTTIAWSYDLLPADEQALFARLSVFAAGCTLESAASVCDAKLETLESLLDKSLVRRRIGSLGEDRFWMLETVREFASEKLQASAEADALQRRHAERMLELARSAHLSVETAVGDQPQRHEIVLAERDDVRAALDWSATQDAQLGLDLALVLENFWATHSPHEGITRLNALVTRAGDLSTEQRARYLRVYGSVAYRGGNWDLGEQYYVASLDAYRELSDRRGEAIVLSRLASHAANARDVARARSFARQTLEIAQPEGMRWIEAVALGALGACHELEGDLPQAWELARRSADIAEECGFRFFQGLQLATLLDVGVRLDRLPEAERAGREALRLARVMEDRRLTLWTLTGLALLEVRRENLDRAGYIWGAAAAELEREAVAPDLGDRIEHLASIQDDRFVTASGRGRAVDVVDAVALALRDDQTLP